MTGSMYWSIVFFFRYAIQDLNMLAFRPNAFHANFILLFICRSRELDLCINYKCILLLSPYLYRWFLYRGHLSDQNKLSLFMLRSFLDLHHCNIYSFMTCCISSRLLATRTISSAHLRCLRYSPSIYRHLLFQSRKYYSGVQLVFLSYFFGFDNSEVSPHILIIRCIY